MHYKNGREAKPGDRIMSLTQSLAGVLYNLNDQSYTCNGRLAATTPNDAYVTLSECLHVDDIVAADVPDSTKK